MTRLLPRSTVRNLEVETESGVPVPAVAEVYDDAIVIRSEWGAQLGIPWETLVTLLSDLAVAERLEELALE